MPGFFEAVAREKARGALLAAWVVEGEAAGAKALFAREAAGAAPLFREDAFPAALAGAISALPPGSEGLMALEGARVFLEPISGPRRLVVCGAGHVALCVIRLGVMLGYDLTVIEDRAEHAERARAAGARRVVCRPFGEALDAIPGGPTTAFVIMTREHVHDVECLRRVLQKPCAYAGMMGSHSRSERMRRQMLGEGFDPSRVAQARMPIGLSIGARTPEEIAVAVMAELVSVMNAADSGEGFPPGMLEALAAPDSPAVLALIVEKRGEAPRRPGTKLLVLENGRFLGTVGGGLAEAKILETAREMLREGCREPRLTRFDMGKGPAGCGGEIAVLLLPL